MQSLTFALESVRSDSRPGLASPEDEPLNRRIGPRDGLDALKKRKTYYTCPSSL